MGVLQRSVGVHDGPFHADEVTACALLLFCELVDRERIVRTRNPSRLAQCQFVCDVGREYNVETLRFDHHQNEYTGPYSSAGMVLEYLHTSGTLPQEFAEYLRKTFVHGVDEWDNGRASPKWGQCDFSQIIDSYMPNEHDIPSETLDRAFYAAVEFVEGYLERLRDRFVYLSHCKELVEGVMAQMDTCLVFETSHSWLEPFFALGGEGHPAKFVIMPTGKHWKLRAIPPSYDRRMEVRCPLPKAWAGLSGEELQKASSIPGALFCHKGRFISGWTTKEDALKALKYTIEGHYE